jgi:hypothetical protein
MQMKSFTILVAGTAASVLMLNGFALAQQQPEQVPQLTNREVRQYMGQIERDINQIVQSGNLARLRQWTQNNVADNAVLNRTNAIETEGQSRAISSITITKPDLLRLQRVVLSALSDKLAAIEDFRLDIQVVDVQPVGDSAALVKSRISERATLAPRPGEVGSRMGQQQYTAGQAPEAQRATLAPRPGEVGPRIGQQQYTTGQAPEAQAGDGFDDAQPRSQQRGRLPRGPQAGLQLEAQATCTHLIERNPGIGRLQIEMGICDAQTEAQF